MVRAYRIVPGPGERPRSQPVPYTEPDHVLEEAVARLRRAREDIERGTPLRDRPAVDIVA